MTLQEAIDRLPNTADGIAESLKGRRYLGCKGNARQCPIALYLLRSCPGLDSLHRVKPWGVDSGDVQCLDFYFPSHVCEFIRKFDNGDYPELEHPEAVRANFGYRENCGHG